MKPPRMTPEAYSAAIAALELNQISAARFLGVSPRTSHWYAHGRSIPHTTKLLLELMIDPNPLEKLETLKREINR